MTTSSGPAGRTSDQVRSITGETEASLNTVRVPLRWRDLDYQGHVYHAEFLTIADEARTHWLGAQLGLKDPQACVIASITIDYMHELSRDHRAVDVSIAIEKLGRSSITTKETFSAPSGLNLANLTCVLIPWDPKTRKKRPLSEKQRAHATAHLMSSPLQGADL